MNKAFVTFAAVFLTPFYFLTCTKVFKRESVSGNEKKSFINKLNGKSNTLFVKPTFINPIGKTNNNIEFKEDGKVYLLIGDNKQTYDITRLQQQRRLLGIKKMIQNGR